MKNYVVAVPAMGVQCPLSHCTEIMEHTCDQAIGEACGHAMKKCKDEGIDINHPDFIIIISFRDNLR
jgi:hypothetical protein